MNDARRAGQVVLAALLVVLATWALAIRPAHRDAARLDGELARARATTAEAAARLVGLREAERRAPEHRRALRELSTALPASGGTADLVRHLDATGGRARVRLTSVGVADAAASGLPSGDLPPGAVVRAGGPPGVPLTFVYGGGTSGLAEVVERLQDAVRAVPGGGVLATGRLVSVDAVQLELYDEDAPAKGVRAEVDAVAHVAPGEATTR